LFGNTAGTSTGAGLFGNTSTQSNQTASGSLFGASITTQPASTGLFGNSTTTSQPATGNSLFGSNSQPLATRSLFGNSNTAGGGTFGSTNNNTGGGGGIFGSTAPAQGGGIFGQSNQQQQQQQQQQQPQSQALNQSALFGRPNATGLYASTLTVPASLAASIGGSTLGGGFKGRGAMIPAPVGPVDPATQFMQLSAKLEGVQKAWDSRNPECRFQV
jgi:nuclear pore complex protein Nup54